MCTLVILSRPGHEWPIILGANRDEMADRPWLPPGRHWSDRPQVIGGLDQMAGGSWLGLNASGVVAAINNRTGSLGQQAHKHSRGELVLEALEHYSASDAAEALSALNPLAYRSFNLVIADHESAYWLRNLGTTESVSVEVQEIPPGLSMITAGDLNDPACPRIRSYLHELEKAAFPDPAKGDWTSWERLFACRLYDVSLQAEAAMLVSTGHGFNTLSSSFIALPSHTQDTLPIWRFASRYPTVEPYLDIDVKPLFV